MSEKKATALDFGLLWLRVLTGLGMAYHGYMKFGNMQGFVEGVQKMGMPAPELMAWLAVMSELVGGFMLVMGFGTRIAAFLIFATMFVAAFIRHGSDPFSAKELALAYWTIAGALIFTGAGFYSVDQRIKRI